jgi:hypothetical protein
VVCAKGRFLGYAGELKESICVSQDQLDVQLVLADMFLLVAEVVKIDERSK